MNETKVLKTQSYSQIVRDFAEQNFNLKVLCGCLLGLLALMLILTLYLVKKGPTVIALDNTGEVSRLETKITDLQIQAAAKEYISFRYNWNNQDIGSQLKKAEFFVSPSLIAPFRKSMTDVQKFVVEKKVQQRVYPNKINVDLKAKKIVVLADRITQFDQLKAATEMRLTLSFDIDDRSVVNPWGVFIVKETEEDKGGPQ